jgi:hypothetical protein
MLKFLWAPFVDRYGSVRFGARRVWIVPLQLAGILRMLSVSRIAPSTHLGLVAAAVFVPNLVSATQDIATDALAIDYCSAARAKSRRPDVSPPIRPRSGPKKTSAVRRGAPQTSDPHALPDKVIESTKHASAFAAYSSETP